MASTIIRQVLTVLVPIWGVMTTLGKPRRGWSLNKKDRSEVEVTRGSVVDQQSLRERSLINMCSFLELNWFQIAWSDLGKGSG